MKFEQAHRHGELRQRVHCLAPGKRILHDDGLDLDELTAWIGRRHAAGGPVAVHCVTAAQLVVTLAALRAAGTHPRDRIEHAAVVPDDSLADLAGLGRHGRDPTQLRRRARRPVPRRRARRRTPRAVAGGLAAGAGVKVALSTDMPFGDGDPWAAMRAAVHRTTAAGAVLGRGRMCLGA